MSLHERALGEFAIIELLFLYFVETQEATMSGRTIELAVSASSRQRIACRQSSNALEKRKVAAEAAGNYFRVYTMNFKFSEI